MRPMVAFIHDGRAKRALIICNYYNDILSIFKEARFARQDLKFLQREPI